MWTAAKCLNIVKINTINKLSKIDVNFLECEFKVLYVKNRKLIY